MGKKVISKHGRTLAIVAASLAGLLSIGMVMQISAHMSWRSWLPEVAVVDVPATQPAAEVKDKKPAPPPELHASIKKRNIFQPPVKEAHGLQLTGVIGRTALFNKGAINEGESAHGIKVVSINEYDVTIDFKGKTEVMRLFPDKKPVSPSQPRATSAVMPQPSKGGAPMAPPTQPTVKSAGQERGQLMARPVEAAGTVAPHTSHAHSSSRPAASGVHE